MEILSKLQCKDGGGIMILTIFALLMVIVGAVILHKAILDFADETIGSILLVMGAIMLICCLIGIIFAHIGSTDIINQNNIRYESLKKRLEYIDSSYEDVSKSDVIKDIAEWNQEVVSYRYWTNNPFTNWMHSKKVAESYKYIEYWEISE